MLTDDADGGPRRQPVTSPWTATGPEVGRTAAPALRAEWIDRPRLVDQVARSLRSPVVLVAAPAGYGKSTLVTQWSHRTSGGGVAWMTVEPGDNDPTLLWTHLAASLEAAGCGVGDDAAAFVAQNADAIPTTVVPLVVEALAGAASPFTLVLEDCHLLRAPECCEQLDRLIDRLPAGVHLVLISRSDPLLRLGRLRVEGRLAEIRTSDLAFSVGEAAALLANAGISLSDSAVIELVRRSEGWVAALYLACLSLGGRDDAEAYVRRLTGSNRFIADYLSEEVLGRQDVELRDFILDMSVFERFDVAFADFVTGTHHARRLVDRLERTNLFLIPQPADETFRFHRLFATFARAALEIERPERVVELHRRASVWFAERDEPEDAIRHAVAGGDLAEAAHMVQASWIRYFDAGRAATVQGWLAALRGTAVDDAPAATVTAAWMAALTGDEREMRRRLDRLAAMPASGALPDGTTSSHAALVLIRGLFGYDGPDRMLDDAQQAVELETRPATPWYAVARVSLGHAAFVVGDLDRARTRLTEAARATAAPQTVRVLALGTLSLCEAEQGESALSRALAEEAMQVVTQQGMENRPQSTFAYTALGRSLAEEGCLTEAAAVLAEGLVPRRQVPGLSPWPLIHHLTAMAAVAVRSGRRDEAEQLLAEVDLLTPWQGVAMTATRRRIDQVRCRLRARAEVASSGDPLTPREVEILHRLQGTQTLREIASDLYVSHNTVKTITLSVYRKLGAHSRAEAVALSRQHTNGVSPG